jgi:hypothetical protein
VAYSRLITLNAQRIGPRLAGITGGDHQLVGTGFSGGVVDAGCQAEFAPVIIPDQLHFSGWIEKHKVAVKASAIQREEIRSVGEQIDRVETEESAPLAGTAALELAG